ncbi:MAG: sigma-70 family RNA polymerase sigma factor [Planctomycetota bacterium]
MSSELSILVDECLAGDQLALGELVNRFRGQVYGLCYRMLGQKEDAEDATQETMVRVVRNLHRWDSNRAFEPWLLTIAGNRCRTRLAKRIKRPNHLTLEHPLPDSRWMEREAELLSEEINLALADIRPEYRRAFQLFHEQELCYAEIAETLSIPLGTVKTWVHRARREIVLKLRKRGVFGDSKLPTI